MMKTRWFANLFLLFVTFVWGSTFTLTKGALAHVPAFTFLAVRFCIASLFLLLFSLLSPISRKSFSKRTWALGALLGLMLFGTYALQTVGLLYTTPAKAGFLTGLFVVLVPLLGMFVLRRAPQPRMWVAVFMALAGLALLCGAEIVHLALGDSLCLSCAVFAALQMLFIEKYGRRTNPLALATVEILVLTICCALTALFVTPSAVWNAQVWTKPAVFWAIVICAIPGTAIAFWAQNVFQAYTTSAQTALIFSMEPVFSWLIAWVALGETLTPAGSIGCLLIFLSTLAAEPSIQFNRVFLHEH